MLTGNRPGVRPGAGDPDFGQVNPRIVDRLHRTTTWARAVALISFLGIAAVLAGCAVAWFHEAGGGLVPLALSLAAFLALAALLPALSLFRFARVVEQMTQWNRGPSLASAFEHLGFFWRRAGLCSVALLLAAVGGGLLLLPLSSSGPVLTAFVGEPSEPEPESRTHQSPLVLKAARFGRNAPVWFPVLSPPASPGRSLTFEEIGRACPAADTTFLCVLNEPGEWVGGGSRRVITGDEATFTVVPRTIVHLEDSREILEVALSPGHGQPSSLRLGPPKGFPLMKMAYEGSSGSIYGSERPFLTFSPPGSLCWEEGRFHVKELAQGADGLPDRLVVDFEVVCPVGPKVVGRLSLQAVH